MAEIKVNSQVLRDAASQIKSGGQNFQELMGEMTQGLESLGSLWEGDAFNSFMQQLNSLRPSLESYAKVINDYGVFLDTAAEQYEQTEVQTQSQTDDLVNNLFK